MKLNISNHPCFNKNVRKTCARVHLPVAPKCNIQCNFCNRLYDCVNESRPGVTSAVLSPEQALAYLKGKCRQRSDITVAGIAGPGDPFANSEQTMETFRLVRAEFPDMLLCVATNGLGIGPHIEELCRLKVSHVTITVNAIDPKIAARIYPWVRHEDRLLHGPEAGAHLLKVQQAALRQLRTTDIRVKINTIIIPGINDGHIEAVAERIGEIGGYVMNCIAMIPSEGSAFENIPEAAPAAVRAIRDVARGYMPQMEHCVRCRADACGHLGESMKFKDAQELVAYSKGMEGLLEEGLPVVFDDRQAPVTSPCRLREREEVCSRSCAECV